MMSSGSSTSSTENNEEGAHFLSARSKSSNPATPENAGHRSCRLRVRRTALGLALLVASSFLWYASNGAFFRTLEKQRRRLRSSRDTKGRGLGALSLSQYTEPATTFLKQAASATLADGTSNSNDPVSPQKQAQASTGPGKVFYCGAPYYAYKALIKARGADADVSTAYSLLGSRIADVLFAASDNGEEEGEAPIPLTQGTLSSATADDVVVVVMHQYCDVANLDVNFPGRQLHINHEYYDIVPNHPLNVQASGALTLNHLPPGERSYMIGPHPDVPDKSVRVTYCQLCYSTYPLRLRNRIIQHRSKVHNTKKHFLLYAASHFVRHREEAAFALAEIGAVHVAGQCQGNHMADVSDWTDDQTYHTCVPFNDEVRPSNIEPIRIAPPSQEETQQQEGNDIPPECIFGRFSPDFTNDYRFALVMENLSSPGYITEKILGAFLGGSVPIYYGTTEIFDIFNQNAFVYYDVNDPTPALAKIAHLEANPSAYDAVLNQPILANGIDTTNEYFSFFLGEAKWGRGSKLRSRLYDMMGYVTAEEIERAERREAMVAQSRADPGWDRVEIYYGGRGHLGGIRPDVDDQSFSQAGQDTLVQQLLSGKQKGYFIDLASNDATRLSNTLALERDLNWMGLCVEPNPAYWYRLAHRKCHVVGAMVGKERGQEVQARFDNGALGGIVGPEFDNKEMPEGTKLERRYTVDLASILRKFHVPRHIDYLSLDVEGAELYVMEAFPFDEYEISVLTVERPSRELQHVLRSHGYVFVKLVTDWGETLWAHESAVDERVQEVADDHPCWPPKALWCSK